MTKSKGSQMAAQPQLQSEIEFMPVVAEITDEFVMPSVKMNLRGGRNWAPSEEKVQDILDENPYIPTQVLSEINTEQQKIEAELHKQKNIDRIYKLGALLLESAGVIRSENKISAVKTDKINRLFEGGKSYDNPSELQEKIKTIDIEVEGLRAEVAIQQDMVEEAASQYVLMPEKDQKALFKATKAFNGQNTPVLAMAGNLTDRGEPLSAEERLAINGTFRVLLVALKTQAPKPKA